MGLTMSTANFQAGSQIGPCWLGPHAAKMIQQSHACMQPWKYNTHSISSFA